MDSGSGLSGAPRTPAWCLEDAERDIPSAFEERVRWHADREALRTPELVFTYDALNRRANRVAHGLIADGLVP
ncbi:MAG: hypothetical protein J0L84_19940, partial [Verrucomicrobia bacterium]|nr:hypothetical protein [Verrucomicrobiota bacterium]